jgi:hypothetical protein
MRNYQKVSQNLIVLDFTVIIIIKVIIYYIVDDPQWIGNGKYIFLLYY